MPLDTATRSTEHVRVGATIREMRQMRGMTLDELAHRVGKSRPYLANIEAGRKRLTPVMCALVAQALRVPQISLLAPEDAA